jgi:hypothetical protein
MDKRCGNALSQYVTVEGEIEVQEIPLALFFLLMVFFIVIMAIVLVAFPPQRIAEWLTKSKKK